MGFTPAKRLPGALQLIWPSQVNTKNIFKWTLRESQFKKADRFSKPANLSEHLEQFQVNISVQKDCTHLCIDVIHTFVHILAHVRACIRTHSCIYSHMSVLVFAHIRACIRTHSCIYSHKSVHIFAHIRAYIRTHPCIYSHNHK